MLQKVKKEKKEKENRINLKMFTSLIETPSIAQTLYKNYKNKNSLNALRIATVIQFNYLMSTYFELINKLSQIESFHIKISDLKVGIIGGGVIGRLFLNSLLVFEKEGFSPKNISLSTRQVEDFQHYAQNFGINVHFNNQKVVEESDILIITVPSTLDNWVIVDLKESFENRIKKAKIFEIQPFIFITTSNMNSKKLQRLFNFPILTPSIRGQDTEVLKQLANIKEIEEFEKSIKDRITDKEHILKVTEALLFVLDKVFNKSLQSTLSDQTNKKSIQSVSNSSLHPSIEQEDPSKVEIISEVMNLQQTPDNTFMVRCKKWRMAHHNFIS